MRNRWKFFALPLSALVLLVVGLLLPITHRTASYQAVDLHALGFFDFDERNGGIHNIPAEFRALDGKKVCLEGFMIVSTGSGPVNEFQLVYDIQRTSIEGPPRVQERVFAALPQGRKILYQPGLVEVSGTFHVRIQRDPTSGVICSIYDLDVDSVQPWGTPTETTEFSAVRIGRGLVCTNVLALFVWSLWALLDLIRRRSRIVPGICRTCGYDLRACTNRCSECGAENPYWLLLPKPRNPAQ